ncbi:5'-3' exoribonuclease 2 [Dimargaris verticillata]|uniref:5'-3' exoribonuclease n=1 Tax=Dimargaris verticillata TaxID=2761393 RepID=A0A9W8B8Q1_9FUNG|nr:5'-3' exoribonuclease 2 [Dimargaris verticillata]
MGVPSFFRWLVRKYPKITDDVVEEQPTIVNGHPIPINTLGENPNGMEFDNLYLDMNGIIHPCCHPQGKPAPATVDEMMIEIFKYIDRLFNMVRPRKVIYMAIDGVAPRAKMNQQRSRRFRAVLEASLMAEEASNEGNPDEKANAEGGAGDDKPKLKFDSNTITPGTPFMAQVAESLRYYAAEKLNNDPGWKKLKVIISDASVPGEGEHKLMDFIRLQRLDPAYDPNTSHVLYGLDADLIMLALATHEPHFKILREDVTFELRGGKCLKCHKPGHKAAQCPMNAPRFDAVGDSASAQPEVTEPEAEEAEVIQPFIFLHVNILREYLNVQLRDTDSSMPFDLERSIDDWVFLCFFVGNDFLPHLPSLEIREGALDKLVTMWKTTVRKTQGYLTDSGKVNLDRVQLIMNQLGRVEPATFVRRREEELRRETREREREMAGAGRGRGRPSQESAPPQVAGAQLSNPLLPASKDSDALVRESNQSIVAQRRELLKGNKDAASKLRAELDQRLAGTDGQQPSDPTTAVAAPSEDNDTGDTNEPGSPHGTKRKASTLELPEDAADGDAKRVELSTNGSPMTMAVDNGGEDDEGPATDSASETMLEGTVLSDGMRTADSAADELTQGADGDAAEENGIEVEGAEDNGDGKADATSTTPTPSNTDTVLNKEDEVCMWEAGYKDRYYQSKFSVSAKDEQFVEAVVKAYVEGLCWVLKYYYQGCVSWKWYYPYHYAPFASDFKNIAKFDIKFELGFPINPIEQLMSVLPAASRASVPEEFGKLMTDPDSEVIDFYPERFQLDLNGKKFLWQAVALLPFIDEKRLHAALAKREHTLTEEERIRNTHGDPRLVISTENPMYGFVCDLYSSGGMGGADDGNTEQQQLVKLDPTEHGRIAGFIGRDPHCIPHTTFHSPFPAELGKGDISDDNSISVVYRLPMRKPAQHFVSGLLPGVRMPPRVLTDDDFQRLHRRFGGPRGADGGGGGYHSENWSQYHVPHRGGGGGYRGGRGGYGGRPPSSEPRQYYGHPPAQHGHRARPYPAPSTRPQPRPSYGSRYDSGGGGPNRTYHRPPSSASSGGGYGGYQHSRPRPRPGPGSGGPPYPRPSYRGRGASGGPPSRPYPRGSSGRPRPYSSRNRPSSRY